jgi:hypothetical protein
MPRLSWRYSPLEVGICRARADRSTHPTDLGGDAARVGAAPRGAGSRLETAFADVDLGEADGTDVLAYLAEEHPRVTRVHDERWQRR